MPEFERITVARASEMLDAGQITPMDLVEQAISATEKYQKAVNAYITFLPDAARAEAERVYAEIKANGRKSPLHGIPYAVKDLIFVKGVPCTAGSKQMKDFIPDRDGASVAAMKKAGAVFMGKTNTQEWGCGPTGQQSCFGPVRNPWNTECISGGSSSGSAAAVATGMVPCAIGSDAGGSIRIPASLCGVVGFKPSFGLVSGEGALRGSISLAHTGPIASTVEDTALMLDVIAAPNPPVYHEAVKNCGSLKGARISVPENLFSGCIQPGVREVFDAAVERLRRAGAEVFSDPITWLEDIPTLSSAISFPEIAYLHRQRLLYDPDGYQPAIRARIERGFSYSAVEYIEAMQRKEELKTRWQKYMADRDAVLMPTEPVTAFPLFTDTLTVCGKEEDSSALLVKHTRAANLIGCPALSVPAGFAGGLPVGVMFMGQINEDARTLQIGHMFEKAVL